MTTLHDRLSRLADEAPVALPEPDLWQRGRRYRRRRRAGTLAIVGAAVLALGVLAGTTWERSSVDGPQPAGGRAGLPDRIWSPSPWLEGTDDAGELGQLAALVTAERGSWTGKSLGAVGVSATTGEYRFLDLPDAEPDVHVGSSAALSPDGRHVAYWLTGPTTGSPNSDSGPVVGLGVYDTTTGEVRRTLVPTEHGLSPDYLLWADAGRVVFSAGQYLGGDADSLNDQSSAALGRVTLWDLADQAPAPLPGVARGADVVGAGNGRLVIYDQHRSYRVIDLADRSADRRLKLSQGLWGSLVTGPAADRVAGVQSGTRKPGQSRSPNYLVVGPLSSQARDGVERVQLTRVPTSRWTVEALSWLDGDHLAVLRAAGADCCRDRRIYRDTVSTGASEQLVRFPEPTEIEVATGLLGAPTLPGAEPPRPLDPRLVAGLGAVTLALASWALVLWRRRVRP